MEGLYQKVPIGKIRRKKHYRELMVRPSTDLHPYIQRLMAKEAKRR